MTQEKLQKLREHYLRTKNKEFLEDLESKYPELKNNTVSFDSELTETHKKRKR